MTERRGAASSKRRASRRSCYLLMLGAWMLCATVTVAQAAEGGSSGHQATQQDSSDPPGAAPCAQCHQEIVKSFASNPHNRPASIHLGTGVTCESCHGPGRAHAEGVAVSLIFGASRATAKEVDQRCQECHGAQRAHFEQSAHAKHDVSCIRCHVIHAAGGSRDLLRMEQPELCFQCHGEVKPQFSAPFHHKVQEGLINCTDCHDPHGTLGKDSKPSAAWQFKVCTKCHLAAAGPFVYEHAAVMEEGCTACHFPHGGPYPQLLVHAGVNTICAQCHYLFPRTGLAAVPEHIQSPQSQSCTSCHASIHGSNTSAVFLESRQAKSEPRAP